MATLKGEKRVNSLDLIIAANVRKFRVSLGISKQELGSAINVSAQQIQKYENGQNRISRSNMYLIAKRLKISTESLYNGMLGKEKMSKELILGHEVVLMINGKEVKVKRGSRMIISIDGINLVKGGIR